MAKQNQQITRNEEIHYMSHPLRWVRLICLIKRYVDGRLECAYLVGNGPNIYHGNMWKPSAQDRKESFESFEAIVDAGWVVD